MIVELNILQNFSQNANYVLENEMMHGTKERVGVVSLNENNTQNYRKIQRIDIANFTAKRKPLS